MSLNQTAPFRAVVSGTVTLAVSATSTNYALATYPTNAPLDSRSVYILVQGANPVHIEFHNSSAGIAATSGVAMPVWPGVPTIVGINGDTTRVVALAVSGPSLTSFTIGYGL